MTALDNHRINQLKWLYSAMTGVCAAYFLALFSGEAKLGESIYLQLSTLAFAISLPLFTTFSLAHVIMIERALSSEACEAALKQSWVIRLTTGGLIVFASGFLLLIGHFSISAMLGSFVVSVCCFFSMRGFLRGIKSAADT